MRLALVTTSILLTLACGGSEPAPASAPEEPAKAEEPAAEEPAAEEAAEEEAAEEGAADLASMTEGEQLTYLKELGEKVYTTGGSGGLACVTCHQANGAGMPPSFPPLVGQKEWMGTCEKHAGYVIHGLKGEIEVGGTTYNGVMPAQGNLTDEEIAAVITYERTSWGNDYGPCLPEAVAAARKAPAPTGK